MSRRASQVSRSPWILVATGLPLLITFVAYFLIPYAQTRGATGENASDFFVGGFYWIVWVTVTLVLSVLWWRTAPPPSGMLSAWLVGAIQLGIGALCALPYSFFVAEIRGQPYTIDYGGGGFEPTFALVGIALVFGVGISVLRRYSSRHTSATDTAHPAGDT